MPNEPAPVPVHTRRTRFDPADELRRLSAGGPVTRVSLAPGAGDRPLWLVTGYHEVRQVLGDQVRFSTSRFGARTPGGTSKTQRPDDGIGLLMDYDPPEHTRLRKMLTPEFTVRRMRRLRPRIEAIVTECLDAVERAGQPADLVGLFAAAVPGPVLCELIGVPRDDRDDFLRRCHAHLETGKERGERAAAGTAFTRYLAALVARQRKDPDEGFLGMLVRDHGEEFTDKELRGICVLLMLAGLDNISGMLGLGTLALLENPGQLAVVRDDPAALDRGIEELLRYLSVPHAPTPRTAVEDMTLGGKRIRAGDTLVCSIPLANRDPALIDEPDRLDLTREPGPHVAFGHGIHHCLGAALARMELRIGYAELLRRFPGLRLAIPAEDVEFRVRSTAYGVERLPVTW
ncbi:cytochrome P450 [Streptomyces alboniger]|uniref:Cytochrome P450 n=1 Tax=Streptomyces alboniger TaxID=132473 RepID=A0A5J6HMN0_STRAD|nr:cytochrome P450 [Streptomyces alboniger]QEV21559.1 cytochrome P450 [Streptomyces alboniger]